MEERCFHESVGGTRRKDRRFIDKPPAPDIRLLIVSIRKEKGLTNEEIAERLGVSGSTLSRTAGGGAGTRLKRSGRSTTQEIVDGLRKLLGE